MKNFLLLTKVQLLNVFKQSNKKKSRIQMSTYLITALAMLFCGVFYTNMFFDMYDASQYATIPYSMTYIVTLLIIMMGMNTSQGMLFGFKDFDMLKALPITDKELVLSKIVVYTVAEFISAAFFLGPVMVITGLRMNLGVTYYLFSLIGFFTVPLIPIVLASFIGSVVQKLSAGRKYADLIKNVIGIVFFLVFYIGYMYMTISKQALDFTAMNNIMGNIVITAKWYVQSAMEGNVLYLLASMGLSLVVYLLFVYIYSKNIVNINIQGNVGYHEKNFKMKLTKSNSIFMALFKKEEQRFFKNFLYVFNTAFGMMLLVCAAVFVLFNQNEIVSFVKMLVASDAQVSALIGELIVLVIFIASQLTCTTGCSISLEGKSFWIMKTLPIDELEVFWSKILVNVLLIVIPSTLSLVLLGIGFGLSWLYYVQGLLLILFSSLAISFFGLFTNLLFPKLQFANEQEVIKQSLASFVSVLVPMMISFVVMGLYFNFALDKGVPYVLWYIIIGYGVVAAILYFLLIKVGVKKYRALI